jgi:pimeloyl-ACP methyl ester carboxylesterase
LYFVQRVVGVFVRFSLPLPIMFKMGGSPFLNNFNLCNFAFIVKASVENIYFDKSKITSSVIDRYYELALREGNRQAFIDRSRQQRTQLRTQIKTIQQPTLVLWGAKDLLIPLENATKFHNDLLTIRSV